MTRQRLSTRQRVDLFHRHGGACHMCGGEIYAGQEWDVSHAIPLELGGADDASNMAPAHRKCHRAHTAAVDVPAISRAKRREAAFIGAKAPSRNPLPGGRRSALKRKMNGQVVLRSQPSHDH
jgi:5-methylcytosine-specific restriction protein A